MYGCKFAPSIASPTCAGCDRAPITSGANWQSPVVAKAGATTSARFLLGPSALSSPCTDHSAIDIWLCNCRYSQNLKHERADRSPCADPRQIVSDQTVERHCVRTPWLPPANECTHHSILWPLAHIERESVRLCMSSQRQLQPHCVTTTRTHCFFSNHYCSMLHRGSRGMP